MVNPLIARLVDLSRMCISAAANARQTQGMVAEHDVRKVMALYRDMLEEAFPEGSPELNDARGETSNVGATTPAG